ncbi:hypothetical protein C2S51_008484, partial [Perilla frutescens var. frutescens]
DTPKAKEKAEISTKIGCLSRMVLANENGVTTAQVGSETFMRLYGSIDGDYSNMKSPCIVAEVYTAIEYRSLLLLDSSKPQNVNTTSIYLNVMNVEKRCVFGLGC